MTLGQYLIQYRAAHDISQRQLAVKCGVSNGYIAMIEKNLNPNTGKPIIPTLPQLKKIALGMGMSLSELIEVVDDMPVEMVAASDLRFSLSRSTENSLTPVEQELLRKFRCLDDRGKSAVLNTLEHEYTALPGEKTISAPKQA